MFNYLNHLPSGLGRGVNYSRNDGYSRLNYPQHQMAHASAYQVPVQTDSRPIEMPMNYSNAIAMNYENSMAINYGSPMAQTGLIPQTGHDFDHFDYGYGGRGLKSKTNLYICGLAAETTSENLKTLCAKFGPIHSTKAIHDKETKMCLGYGFVNFSHQKAAESALKCLRDKGMQVHMARCSEFGRRKSGGFTGPKERGDSQYEYVSGNSNHSNDVQHQEEHGDLVNSNMPLYEDPTNLFISNLPSSMTEKDLKVMFSAHGKVVSARILMDRNFRSRRIGFVRMETIKMCEDIIAAFHHTKIFGSNKPLKIKFAERKQHQCNINEGHDQNEVNQMSMYANVPAYEGALPSMLCSQVAHQNYHPVVTMPSLSVNFNAEPQCVTNQLSFLPPSLNMGLNDAAHNELAYPPETMPQIGAHVPHLDLNTWYFVKNSYYIPQATYPA